MTERTPMVDGCRESECARLGSVLELRIPADAGSSVRLAVLRRRASELSDAIGGGLSEDALIGTLRCSLWWLGMWRCLHTRAPLRRRGLRGSGGPRSDTCTPPCWRWTQRREVAL